MNFFLLKQLINSWINYSKENKIPHCQSTKLFLGSDKVFYLGGKCKKLRNSWIDWTLSFCVYSAIHIAQTSALW